MPGFDRSFHIFRLKIKIGLVNSFHMLTFGILQNEQLKSIFLFLF